MRRDRPRSNSRRGEFSWRLEIGVFHSKLYICRNEQRKAQKTRYFLEKELMESLRVAGKQIGEYHEEDKEEREVILDDVDLGDVPVDNTIPSELNWDSSDDAHPLLFIHDCESTGFVTYNDHIIEIAAEVVDCPVPCDKLTYSSFSEDVSLYPSTRYTNNNNNNHNDNNIQQ